MATIQSTECYNRFGSCNRSPTAQSDPQQCNLVFQACMKEVEEEARDEARRKQADAFRSAHSGGHGGGYASREPETTISPAPKPRATLNTQPQKFTDIPLSPQRAMRAEVPNGSSCPQSGYPYQGTNGVVCTSTGEIAQRNLLAARGRMENEMMGFFSEISRTAP